MLISSFFPPESPALLTGAPVFGYLVLCFKLRVSYACRQIVLCSFSSSGSFLAFSSLFSAKKNNILGSVCCPHLDPDTKSSKCSGKCDCCKVGFITLLRMLWWNNNRSPKENQKEHPLIRRAEKFHIENESSNEMKEEQSFMGWSRCPYTRKCCITDLVPSTGNR